MRRIILSVIGILLFTFSFSQKAKSPWKNAAAAPQEVNVHAWIEKNFAKGQQPPFSFTYGGKDSRTFITQWDYSSEVQKSTDPSVENFIYTYKDNETGLLVKCIVTGFKDFNAVEWVLKFYNSSDRNSPIIEKSNAVDVSFDAEKNGPFYLHYARGCSSSKKDFEPSWAKLEKNKSIYLTPTGGCSSWEEGFPYFNIERPDQQGTIVAVGWTGKWFADIKLTNERSVSLLSGMEKMKLTLYPNEEIRSPRMCMLFWKGDDRMIGHNQFRRFMLAQHTAKINGKKAELPFSFTLGNGGPSPCNEFTCATEDYMVAMAKRHKKFDLVPDVLWLDAGWYKGCGLWWKNVGNWTIDKGKFPNGFKTVSKAVHDAGAKFLVWFEPERVYKGTDLDKEHPEFLLRPPVDSSQGEWLLNSAVFNLGDPKGRMWMTDHVSDMIRKEGIDYYRQDFNLDPKRIWAMNDKPDRIGMTEIRHIEGLYAFWDSLLTRFPNLLIDNCAGGGRRLDLEAASRSFPLWRSDYFTDPNAKQCHTYGLNYYLPLHGTGLITTSVYDLRSSLGAAIIMGMDINATNNLLRETIQEYKRLRPYYYGDYYPLTDYYGPEGVTSDKVWFAYQMNRPEQKDGIILAFRRPECDQQEITIKLKGLEEKANYEVYYEDYNINFVRSGAELMKGLSMVSLLKPGSLLVSYKKL